MDKYEYKLKLDQMKSAFAEGNYHMAEELADSINWKRVRNANSLIKAGEVYETAERYVMQKKCFCLHMNVLRLEERSYTVLQNWQSM